MDLQLNLEKLFKNIDQTSPVLVAVSGGIDSVALLLLSNVWAKDHKTVIHAVTVDHGLRPEAASEAAFVAALCARLKVTHKTLSWQGNKPQTGISNAARLARYELIEQYAIEIGAKTILVGQQANDQAETFIMRNRRESEGGQWRGLSGMSSVSVLPNGTRLHRPLLYVTRAQLKSYLQGHGQVWIEDPSNDDDAYERVGVRRLLAESPEMVEQCLSFTNVMGRFRYIMAQRAAHVLKAYVSVLDGPVYKFPIKGMRNIAPQIQELILQVLVSMAGGAEYFHNTKQLIPLIELDAKATKRTLGGAVIERRKDMLYFYREKRNIRAQVVKCGEKIFWDGRFMIENFDAPASVCSAFPIRNENALAELSHRGLRLKPKEALKATLWLRAGDEEYSLPFVSGFEPSQNIIITPVYRAIEHFCPDLDFPLLDFISEIKALLVRECTPVNKQ